MSPKTHHHPPWYRQFWPWVLIAIPLSAVIGGAITLWLAVTRPDSLVVDETEYRQIRSELRAQDTEPDAAGDGAEPADDGGP